MAVNVNTANKEELLQLPNIGERRAQSILDLRGKKGTLTAQDLLNDQNLSAVAQGLLETNRIVFTVEIVDEQEGPQQLNEAVDSIGNQKDLFDLIKHVYAKIANVNANLEDVSADIVGLSNKVDTFQGSFSNKIDFKVGELVTKVALQDTEWEGKFSEGLPKPERSVPMAVTVSLHSKLPTSKPTLQSRPLPVVTHSTSYSTPTSAIPLQSSESPLQTSVMPATGLQSPAHLLECLHAPVKDVCSADAMYQQPTQVTALSIGKNLVQGVTTPWVEGWSLEFSAAPSQSSVIPPTLSRPLISSVGNVYAPVRSVCPTDVMYQWLTQVTAPTTGNKLVQGVTTTRVEGQPPHEPHTLTNMTLATESSPPLQGISDEGVMNTAACSEYNVNCSGNWHLHQAESHSSGTPPKVSPHPDLQLAQPVVDTFSKVVQKQLSNAATLTTCKTSDGVTQKKRIEQTSGVDHPNTREDRTKTLNSRTDGGGYDHYWDGNCGCSYRRSPIVARTKRCKRPLTALLPTLSHKLTNDWIALHVQFEIIVNDEVASLVPPLDCILVKLSRLKDKVQALVRSPPLPNQ